MPHSKDAFIDLISGSVGGVANVYVGQPLDTVKVKMQTFPEIHRTMTGCFMRTLQNEGIRGLYAGAAPALIANIAENSVLFVAYGACQKGIAYAVGAKKVEDLSTFENASAGFFASFFSSLVLCPTELIKCQLQAQREMATIQNRSAERMGPWILTKRILRHEGILGLFRGLTSTLSREMPGYFMFFGSYEAARAVLTPKGKSKTETGALKTMLCGGIAGIAFWVSVFPTDVAKSRIQVSGSSEPMVRVLREIVRNEGLRALYNGLGATIARTFPSTAALFYAFEATRKFLHNATEN